MKKQQFNLEEYAKLKHRVESFLPSKSKLELDKCTQANKSLDVLYNKFVAY